MRRNMVSCLPLICITFLFLSSPLGVNAADLYVPDQFATIQAAVDAAAAFDTIIVRDGVYAGEGNRNIEVFDTTLILRSEKGPANCIVDCGGAWSGFYFKGSENSIIQGFTITNGDVGIRANNSSPRILDCIIHDNTYAGIETVFWSAPYIQNCVISNNKGCGINLFESAAETMITNCVVTTNAAQGIRCPYLSNGTIQDCRIDHNEGSGVTVQYDHRLTEAAMMTITRCKIAGNGNNGIQCINASPTITNCIITDDTESGIFFSESSAQVVNCSITANGFYALQIAIESTPTVKNTILWSNTMGEILSDSSSLPTVSYSCVTGGYPGENNISSDPLFVNPSAGDFRLSATSPCIDTGTSLGAPDVDFIGTTRPQGAGFDMGAYEYVQTAVNLKRPTFAIFRVDKKIVLSWGRIEGATGYTLFYSPYPDNGEIFSVDMGTTVGFGPFDGTGLAYYAAVKAFNSEGTTGFSNISYFDLR